jgi:hypothetical protein
VQQPAAQRRLRHQDGEHQIGSEIAGVAREGGDGEARAGGDADKVQRLPEAVELADAGQGEGRRGPQQALQQALQPGARERRAPPHQGGGADPQVRQGLAGVGRMAGHREPGRGDRQHRQDDAHGRQTPEIRETHLLHPPQPPGESGERRQGEPLARHQLRLAEGLFHHRREQEGGHQHQEPEEERPQPKAGHSGRRLGGSGGDGGGLARLGRGWRRLSGLAGGGLHGAGVYRRTRTHSMP